MAQEPQGEPFEYIYFLFPLTFSYLINRRKSSLEKEKEKEKTKYHEITSTF